MLIASSRDSRRSSAFDAQHDDGDSSSIPVLVDSDSEDGAPSLIDDDTDSDDERLYPHTRRRQASTIGIREMINNRRFVFHILDFDEMTDDEKKLNGYDDRQYVQVNNLYHAPFNDLDASSLRLRIEDPFPVFSVSDYHGIEDPFPVFSGYRGYLRDLILPQALQADREEQRTEIIASTTSSTTIQQQKAQARASAKQHSRKVNNLSCGRRASTSFASQRHSNCRRR